MNKAILFLSAALLTAGCVFISPYTVTFTTPNESVVNPDVNTLDLVLNDPALAYISGYQCDDRDAVEILPIVNDNMEPSNVHNLSLALISAEPDGSLCSVTVTAFDRTTTANAAKNIDVFVRVKPEAQEEPEEVPELIEPDYSKEISACSDAGGEWNECGSACQDGDELCIQVCVPKCEFTDEPETTETGTEPQGEESDTEPVL